MKKYIIGLLSSLLIALTIWACDNNDVDLDIIWEFDPEIQLAETSHIKKETDMNLKIQSKVYKQGNNKHYFKYSGSKNSHLISPDGKIIEMNKDIFIPYDGEFHKYKFIGNEGGNHELKFTFYNDKNYKKEIKKTIDIKISDFGFTTTAQATETTVGNPINVAYTLEPADNTTQTFEVRFETSGDGQLDGQNEGVWFNVKEGQGKFIFIPTTAGTHQVVVHARSSLGITKTSTFTVNVGIQDFDFAVAPNSTSGVINTALPINLTISPKGNDTGQVYQFRYILEEGQGIIEGVPAGTWIVLDKGATLKNFLPTSAGVHKITFTAKNTAGTEITKTIELNVSQPTFDLSAVPVNTTAIINEQIDINFHLSVLGDDLGSTYEMAYTSSGLSNLDGHQQNTYFQIQKGNFSLKYTALAIGKHDITIKARNQFGVEKTVTFTVNVSNYDFVFTAVTGNPSPVVNTATPINMDITAIGGDSNMAYSLKYELLTGQGKLENYNVGIFQPINKGAFSMNFIPTTEGEVIMRLTAKNTAGSTHEQIIRFNVQVPDYTFTASSQSNKTTIGIPIGISYNLNGTNQQTFEVMLETNGDGQLGYNGNFYGEGVWVRVNSGSGNFEFKPTTAGQHQVTLKSRSNYGIEKTVSFNTNVETPKFNFTATPTALQFIKDQQSPINLNISPIDNDSGLTYEVKYEITSGVGEIEGMSAGVYKTVNKGDFTFKFSSSQVGQTTIKFTAKNSAGTEVEKTISLQTVSAEFNVTASNLKNDVFINTPVDINYAIDNLGVSQNFEVMMTTNGEGTLNDNQENVWFSISQNSGKLEFKPTSLGGHLVNLHFRNQYGIQKVVSLNVNSISHEFSFIASATSNNVIINNLKTLDFNITQVSSLQGIDYFIKYEILEGEAEVTGMQPNTYLGVNLGNFRKSITPKRAGALKIKFTVKNQYNLVKEQTLIFNVQIPDFTITGNYQSQAVNWAGTPIEISYAINKFISDDQTYEYTVESNDTGTFDGGTTLGTWLPLNNTTGNIMFTPTGTGNQTITIKARNQFGVEKQFSYSIITQRSPQINPIYTLNVDNTTERDDVYNPGPLSGVIPPEKYQFGGKINLKMTAVNGDKVKITSVKVIIDNGFKFSNFLNPTNDGTTIEFPLNNNQISIDKTDLFFKKEQWFHQDLVFSPNFQENIVKIRVIVTNEYGDTSEIYTTRKL